VEQNESRERIRGGFLGGMSCPLSPILFNLLIKGGKVEESKMKRDKSRRGENLFVSLRGRCF